MAWGVWRGIDLAALLPPHWCALIPFSPPAGQDEAISHCYATLTRLGVTGRLRVGREGFNATLTGSREGERAFTHDLRVREAGESVRV